MWTLLIGIKTIFHKFYNMCLGAFVLDTTIKLKNNMNEDAKYNSNFLKVEQIDNEFFKKFKKPFNASNTRVDRI